MLTLQAEYREKIGKSASNRLRILGKLPAIIYGVDIRPIAIELSLIKCMHIENQNSLSNKILDLVINCKIMKVKVWAIQYHPFKTQITHIDFMKT